MRFTEITFPYTEGMSTFFTNPAVEQAAPST